eukprot:TRINITY_DN14200_c0_g1_i1.p1 TRINITY_DN14200_c0_g1~~TRINITY_DN14200_c0_g1_i1.p1  ORF type:complete len:332 (+),score=75.98 TRINITY_DN14200_c0_g1_i1:74-1069(+)
MSEERWYFDSYSSLPMQEVMLRDGVRTEAYRAAILSNRELVADAVVVDCGCGTGVLSVFCAQAGAKAVYAIEASGAAALAAEVVKENGVADVVRVVHGSVEQLVETGELQHDGQPLRADVIVSEWMGFALVAESMLPSVLRARDAWLRPGGHMFPDRARLLVAPFTDPEPAFWENVHGVTMRCLQKHFKPRGDGPDGVFDVLPAAALWGETAGASVLCDWDLSQLPADGAETTLKAEWSGAADRQFDGACLWFDVSFPGGATLSTAPGQPDTHWRQTLLFAPSKSRSGPSIGPFTMSVTLGPCEQNKRYLKCSMRWGTESGDDQKVFPRVG